MGRGQGEDSATIAVARRTRAELPGLELLVEAGVVDGKELGYLRRSLVHIPVADREEDLSLSLMGHAAFLFHCQSLRSVRERPAVDHYNRSACERAIGYVEARMALTDDYESKVEDPKLRRVIGAEREHARQLLRTEGGAAGPLFDSFAKIERACVISEVIVASVGGPGSEDRNAMARDMLPGHERLARLSPGTSNLVVLPSQRWMQVLVPNHPDVPGCCWMEPDTTASTAFMPQEALADDHEAGRPNEVLLHEVFHTGQVGTTEDFESLSDERRGAELMFREGITQKLTIERFKETGGEAASWSNVTALDRLLDRANPELSVKQRLQLIADLNLVPAGSYFDRLSPLLGAAPGDLAKLYTDTLYTVHDDQSCLA